MNVLTQQITNEIDRLLSVYCEECPIKYDLRSRQGKTAAHQFCISGCSVGKQLKEIGQKLYQNT